MYDLLFILFKFCPDGTTNVMPFCLPANVYIELFCIIAGTLSMFSARGCVPVIRPRECTGKYSAMNIDSVKINTSLIMMKECRRSIISPPLMY